jgi:hypothetical protein
LVLRVLLVLKVLKEQQDFRVLKDQSVRLVHREQQD